MVYREFFPRSLTALDTIDESTLGTRPNMSHVTARQEVQGLLAALRLPIDEKGRRRAASASRRLGVGRPFEPGRDGWGTSGTCEGRMRGGTRPG